MIWFELALLIFIFQIATILIIEFRHPAKSVAWLMILFIIPLIGFIVYYFMAKQYSHRRKVGGKDRERIRAIVNSLSRDIDESARHGVVAGRPEQRMHAMIERLPDQPITRHNRTVLLQNGEMTYDSIFRAVERAKHHIHLEYYIVRDDEVGRRLQQLLIEKAKAGVEIRFIYDGVGSHHLNYKYVDKLREAGVEIYCFLPPSIAFFEKRMNYRNHRKIVVVDGEIGFLGGINLGLEYLGGDKKLGFWRDTHVQLEGESVYYLQSVFLNDWMFVSGQEDMNLPEAFFPTLRQSDIEGSERVQIVASGPEQGNDLIYRMIFTALTTAQRRIYFTTPYYIPDRSIQTALKTAALSGLDVRMILPGIPDSRIVKYASLSYIEELMEAGVQVYEYNKGFLHAKMLIVDDKLASVGTANMDLRSFFNNFEINAFFFDRKTIEPLLTDFEADMVDSRLIKLSVFRRRPRLQKILEILSHLLSPLL